MRHFRKMTALIVSLILLIGMLPLHTFALSTDEFDYTLNDDGTITINKYIGSNTVVEIPNTIDDARVTAIGDYAFQGRSTITQVTFPKYLTSIGTSAFYGCKSLTAVDFPRTLQKIGEQAFYNCSNLSTIDIEPTTYNIGYQAFSMTAWLKNAADGPLYLGRVLYTYVGGMFTETEIIVKDGTAAIAPFAFQNRDKLLSVKLPVGLRVIGAMAFLNCKLLADIRIPPSVQTIGSGAFLNAGSATVHGVYGSTAEKLTDENNMFFSYDSTLDYPDGDIDKSGKLTSNDLRKMLRIVAEIDTDYDHERYLSCDSVYDGIINTADIREFVIRLVSL